MTQGLNDINRAATELARTLHTLTRTTTGQARASQAAYRSVELTDGPVSYYDEQGVVRLQVGVQDDGTFAVIPTNGDIPPRPTPPSIEEVPGGFNVTWDGTFEDATRPLDTSHIEIHVAPGPDYPNIDLNQVGTFVSDFGGVYFYASEYDAGDQYVFLATVTLTGAESEKSDEVVARGLPVSAVPITDGLIPAKVGAVTVTPIPGGKSMLLEWKELENADPVDYLIWGSSETGFESNEATLLGFTAAGQWWAQTAYNPVSATVEPVQPGTRYYYRVAARDADGIGIVSDEVSGIPIKITNVDIQPYSIQGSSIADFTLPVVKFFSTQHHLY